MASELKHLLGILEASYGPSGSPCVLKVERSGEGRSTLTSDSYSILKWFPAQELKSKVAIGALLNLIGNTKDCGKFASILFIRIFRSCLAGSSLPSSPHMLSSLLHHVVSRVVDYLDQEDCPCKVKLDLADLTTMLRLVQSSIRTCSSLCLSSEQLDHLSHLTLKAFAETLPTGDTAPGTLVNEHLHYIGAPGEDVERSYLIDGILLEVSDLTLVELVPGKIPRKGPNGEILTALFNISLAGDVEGIASEEHFLSSVVKQGWGPEQFESAAVARMKEAASQLVEFGVGFVGCQKVVHPVIKQLLRRKGVFVMDRLSLAHIGSVQAITNGDVLSTITTTLTKENLGTLTHIDVLKTGRKRFVNLKKSHSSHHTMVLAANSEGQLEDLKANITATVHLLRSAVVLPWALCGGGCTETTLAQHIRQEVSLNVPRDIICTPGEHEKVCFMIAQHLEEVASLLDHTKGITLVDNTTHHCWSLPQEEQAEFFDHDTEHCHLPSQCKCGLIHLKHLDQSTTWRQVGRLALHLNLQFELASVPTTNVAIKQNSCPIILDSFGAKRQTLLSIGDLLSNLVLVSGFILNNRLV